MRHKWNFSEPLYAQWLPPSTKLLHIRASRRCSAMSEAHADKKCLSAQLEQQPRDWFSRTSCSQYAFIIFAAGTFTWWSKYPSNREGLTPSAFTLRFQSLWVTRVVHTWRKGFWCILFCTLGFPKKANGSVIHPVGPLLFSGFRRKQFQTLIFQIDLFWAVDMRKNSFW